MSVTAGTNTLEVDGTAIQLRGFNIYYDGGGALTDAGSQTVLGEFPGLTILRINCQDYPAPASMAPYVNALTAAGCVVEIEDHHYPAVLTGADLTTSANWYASCATYFLSNDRVIFGTQNEPDNSQGPAAVDTEISTIYNAIRGTGNNTLILLCPIGGTLAAGYLTPSVYASMTNVAWDGHFYAWEDQNSTNETDAVNALNALVTQLQSVANIPVVIGEYGPSSGIIVGDDVGGDQVTQAVQASSLTSMAWAWTSGNASLPVLLNSETGDVSQGLTTNFGVPTAAFIAASTPLPSGGGGGSTVVSPFIAPGGSFVIGSDTYTLPGGVVTKNGTAIPGGSGTALMANLGGVVYAQDGTSKNWYTFDGVSTFTPAVVTASGTDTTTTTFLVMASNLIATMSGGQIAFNGVIDAITKNVTMLVTYNGVMSQETSVPAWYSYNGTPGSWTQITQDPRTPATVAPGAPAAPTATATAKISLSWAAVSGTPTPTYTVQHRVNGTTPWTTGPDGLTVLSTAISVPPGASYDVRINAVNSAGTTNGAVKTVAA